MRKTILVALLLAAIGGAAVAQAPTQEPLAIAGVPAFWRDLCDTTLERLIDGAIRRNQDVQAALARVDGARAARSRARFDLAPTVTAAGGFTRQRLAKAAFPIPGNGFPDQSIWDVGVNASWEIDVFGRLRQTLRANGALVDAAAEDVRGLQVTVVSELAQAYFEMRGAQEQLEVARRNAENQRRTLEVTKQRLDAGRGTAFDTERAQAQLSFTLAAIPGAETEIASAQHRIAVLTGRSPSVVAAELGPTLDVPQLPAQVTVTLRDSVIRLRPDVAAADRRVAMEQALTNAARADYLPRLNLVAGAGTASATFDSIGQHGTYRYAVGPSLSWPLLNLGRVRAGVKASAARRDEAAAVYRQTVLLAEEELETALVRYRGARERVTRIEEAAASSRHAAELARLRFTEGVADFLQVLDAERTELDAESQLARAKSDAAGSYAALYRALGGSPAK